MEFFISGAKGLAQCEALFIRCIEQIRVCRNVTDRVHITDQQFIGVLAVDDVKKGLDGQFCAHKDLRDLIPEMQMNSPLRSTLRSLETKGFFRIYLAMKTWNRSIIDLSLPGIPMVITGVAMDEAVHLFEFRVEVLHVIVHDAGVMVFAEHHLHACLEIKTANFNFFNRAAGILGPFERPVEQFCCVTI